ncbi:MAG: hypothetical protein ACKOW9_00535, partial [Candidatus Paceibacterota bacterium]
MLNEIDTLPKRARILMLVPLKTRFLFNLLIVLIIVTLFYVFEFLGDFKFLESLLLFSLLWTFCAVLLKVGNAQWIIRFIFSGFKDFIFFEGFAKEVIVFQPSSRSLEGGFYRRALLFTSSRSASGGSEKTDLWYDGFTVRNLPNEYQGVAVESLGATAYPLNLNGVACAAWSYKGAGLLLLDK